MRMLTMAAGRPESICRLSPPTAIADRSDGGDGHLERLVAGQPAGQEADVAVAERGSPGRSLNSAPASWTKPPRPASAPPTTIAAEQQQPDPQPGPAGRLGVAADHPQPEAPRGRGEQQPADDDRGDEGDDDADVHPAGRRSAAAARRPASGRWPAGRDPCGSFHGS